MKIATVSLVVLVGAAFLLAQQGTFRRGEPTYDELQEIMGLSDQQVEDLKAVNTAFRESIQPLAGDLSDLRGALREQVQSDTPDVTLIEQLQAEIQNIKDQIHQQADEFRAAALGILTSEQVDTLAALDEALSVQGAIRDAIGLNLLEVSDGPRAGFGNSRRGPSGPRGRDSQ